MKLVKTTLALTDDEFALAQRLLAEGNRQRDLPWDMELYLAGIASAAVVNRLHQIASQLADREEAPVISAAPAAAD